MLKRSKRPKDEERVHKRPKQSPPNAQQATTEEKSTTPTEDVSPKRELTGVFEGKTIVHFSKLLSSEEVAKVRKLHEKSLKEKWGSRQRRNFGSSGRYGKSGGHTVTFLEDRFEKELPRLFEFFKKLLERVDTEAQWNILKSVEKYSARRMEFLQYTPKDHEKWGLSSKDKKKKKKRNDGLGWHFDTDSLMTLVVMCSHPHEYEGGRFQIKTKEAGVQTIPVELGDVLVFLSEKTEHRVTPIEGGERCTFVFEIWNKTHYDSGGSTSSSSSSSSTSSSSS